MKIDLRVKGITLTATLNDSPAAREFVRMLPLHLAMDDLLGREKHAPLPRPLGSATGGQATYHAGDIGYWAPGPDVAVYYRDDGRKVPSPGIVILGRIDSGAETLGEHDGPVQVDISLG